MTEQEGHTLHLDARGECERQRGSGEGLPDLRPKKSHTQTLPLKVISVPSIPKIKISLLYIKRVESSSLVFMCNCLSKLFPFF